MFAKRRKMSHSHYCHNFLQKGGKCPTVILTTFQKMEENVPLSFRPVVKRGGKCPLVILTNFQKRRKMSHSHSDKFLQKGGKCTTVILTNVC